MNSGHVRVLCYTDTLLTRTALARASLPLSAGKCLDPLEPANLALASRSTAPCALIKLTTRCIHSLNLTHTPAPPALG